MKSKVKADDKKVWVEVEINKYIDKISVFRGLMLKMDLEAWTRGEFVDCAIKLEHTYWLSDENVFVLGQGEGETQHYSGTTYLRADTIMVIFVLRDDIPTIQNGSQGNIFLFPDRNNKKG